MKNPNFHEERALWNKGIEFVIGVDEVGRGAFAGPIVAAAVVLPQTKRISKKLKFLNEINDSKLLKASVRRNLAKKIKKYALYYSICEVDIATINRIGIGKSNYMVFRKVVSQILSNTKSKNCYLLSDGFRTRYVKGIGLTKQKAIIKGDQKSLSIASASIVAKVHRDSLMRGFSKEYRHYNFSKNKGYGTKYHQKALKIYGLSKIHRTSFDLVKFLEA